MIVKTLEEMQLLLATRLSALLNLAPEELDHRQRFTHYNLDSIGAAALLGELGTLLGRPLSPTLAWEYPTIESLARYLLQGAAPVKSPLGKRRQDEPIAVIGMACRFPQAADIAAFWRLLSDGVDAITDVPRDRWDAKRFYDADFAAPGKMNVRRGGFLDRVDQFDPLFFGISPKEAVQIDPQQRLMLELSWEALEDAGIPADKLRGSPTGVYFGLMWFDYPMLLHYGGLNALTQHTVMGFHHSFTANRVSYVLGLQGPSLSLDSACSSSLVALHLACDSIRRGETTLALIGGVNLNVIPDSTLVVSKVGALSPDGRCYTFDSRANGYVRGEGGGVVVLKPLTRAIADNDPIYCVIRGSAVNNDGPSNGFSAPNPQAQESLLESAYAQAGISPAEVDYVELHGTGTKLGDPIEAAALGRVLGRERPAENPLLVGSVKTNIGHLEAAAGVAGLIKTALSLKYGLIPPSLHLQERNPYIPDSIPLHVQTTLRSWPERPTKSTAGVSSFGMGGTNAHVVLEAASLPVAELVLLARSSPEELRADVTQTLNLLDVCEEKVTLSEFCRTELGEPTEQAHRLAAIVRSKAGLQHALQGYLNGTAVPGVFTGSALSVAKGPIFVFAGQGAQWCGMGRSLMRQEPFFREQIERCDRLIRLHLDWSLIDQLLASEAQDPFDRIDISWPAIVSIEIALAALLRFWGIEPVAVIGHSNGEVAAAQVAGVLTLEDAMRVACVQGHVMRQIRGKGTMGVVALPWDEAEQAITGYSDRLNRAIQASPDTTVLSGDPDALTAVFSELSAKGIFCRRVRVEVAGHSPQIVPLDDELFARMRGVKPRPATIPIICLATGHPIAGEELGVAHWVQHLSAPVLFSSAISTMIQEGQDLFLEVSPHPIVKHSIESTFRNLGKPGQVLATLRRDEDERESLLATVGALFINGAKVNSAALKSGTARFEPAEDAVTADDVFQIVPLSAQNSGALTDLARAYQRYLIFEERDDLHDIAYTASVRRSHLEHRLAVLGQTKAACEAALAKYVRGESCSEIVVGKVRSGHEPKLAFIFSGQGSQWIGMGRELWSELPFRSVIEACDAAIKQEAGWSLLTELWADESQSHLGQIEVVQPVLLSMQLGLAALWQSWGVHPDAVVGHSMGEVVAAQVAGLLSLEDAVRIVCRRSRLMQRLSGAGAMAVVELSLAQAQKAIAGFTGRLAVAASNGPSSTVLSGEPESLEKVLLRLADEGVFCRRVQVEVASHSAQMDALRDELLIAVKDVQIGTGDSRIAMYSTVSVDRSEKADPELLNAEYWFRNLREPVSFWPIIQKLEKRGFRHFIEVSPHPVLIPALEFGKRGSLGIGTLKRGQPARRTMLESLAALYVNGHPIDWSRLYLEGGKKVGIPTYAWQRERYWLDEQPAAKSATSGRVDPRTLMRSHALLGVAFSVMTQPHTRYWERAMPLTELPYLQDHVVCEAIAFPGAAFIEMALAAAKDTHADDPRSIRRITFERMLILGHYEAPLVQSVYEASHTGTARFQVASRTEAGWQTHMRCEIARDAPAASADLPDSEELKRTGRKRTGAEWRKAAALRGLQYGPAFSGLLRAWVGPGEVLAQVELPAELRAGTEAAGYLFHPALLDACMQAAALIDIDIDAVDESADDLQPLIPVAIESVRLRGRQAPQVFVTARARQGGDDPRDQVMDLWIAATADFAKVLVEIRGLTLRRLSAQLKPELGYYEASFSRVDLPKTSTMSKGQINPGRWLLMGDSAGLGARLAQELERRGERCQLLPADELSSEMSAPLKQAFSSRPGVRGVICLATLEEQTSIASPVNRTLAVVQGLLATGRSPLPPLWLVSRGAQTDSQIQSGNDDSAAPDLAQSALIGFARSLRSERADLRVTSFDLPPQRLENETARLVEALLSGTSVDELALRRGGTFGMRLLRVTPPAPERFFARRDGAYLITGGLSGLGLHGAGWLIEQGAGEVILIGRRPPSEATLAVIESLRKTGARIRTARLDVADRNALAELLESVRASGSCLRGVLHAAAVLEDSEITALSAESVGKVLAPKAVGAWNLHELTLDDPLDFFVLFSSIASLIGTPGQANYAAANSFVDALAHERRRQGRPALSVNWGAFSEIGLAAEHDGLLANLQNQGVGNLTPAEGYEALAACLSQEVTQIAIARFVPSRWLSLHPHLSSSSSWSLLAAEKSAQPDQATTISAWQTAARDQRRSLLIEFIVGVVSGLTRIPAAKVDLDLPFSRLGLDSLMAVELRNRLQTETSIHVSLAELLTRASVDSLATYLDDHIATVSDDAMEEGTL